MPEARAAPARGSGTRNRRAPGSSGQAPSPATAAPAGARRAAARRAGRRAAAAAARPARAVPGSKGSAAQRPAGRSAAPHPKWRPRAQGRQARRRRRNVGRNLVRDGVPDRIGHRTSASPLPSSVAASEGCTESDPAVVPASAAPPSPATITGSGPVCRRGRCRGRGRGHSGVRGLRGRSLPLRDLPLQRGRREPHGRAALHVSASERSRRTTRLPRPGRGGGGGIGGSGSSRGRRLDRCHRRCGCGRGAGAQVGSKPPPAGSPGTDTGAPLGGGGGARCDPAPPDESPDAFCVYQAGGV